MVGAATKPCTFTGNQRVTNFSERRPALCRYLGCYQPPNPLGIDDIIDNLVDLWLLSVIFDIVEEHKVDVDSRLEWAQKMIPPT